MRDYHISQFLARGESEEKARAKSTEAVIAMLSGWYAGFIVGVAVVETKLGIGLEVDRNIFTSFIYGSLLLSPCVISTWVILKKLTHEVPTKEISIKEMAWINWTIFVVGLLMIGFIPFALQELLPN